MRSFTMIDFLASDKAVVAGLAAAAAIAAPSAAAAVPAQHPCPISEYGSKAAPAQHPDPISEYGYRIRLRHPAA